MICSRYSEVSCGLSVDGYGPRHGLLWWRWWWGILNRSELFLPWCIICSDQIKIKPLWPLSLNIVSSWTLNNCTSCRQSHYQTPRSDRIDQFVKKRKNGFWWCLTHSNRLKMVANGYRYEHMMTKQVVIKLEVNRGFSSRSCIVAVLLSARKVQDFCLEIPYWPASSTEIRVVSGHCLVTVFRMQTTIRNIALVSLE